MRDRALYRAWLAWFALAYLDDAAVNGQPFVTARDFRAILDSQNIGQGRVEALLVSLRKRGLIARLNSKGRQNRRYYLTQDGKNVLTAYETVLEDKLT